MIRILWFLPLLLSLACGSKAPPAPVVGRAERHVGPLHHLVVPGVPTMLVAQPKVLLESPSVRSLWRAMVAEDHERAFAQRTGVDPLQVSEFVALEVPPHGYIVMARGPFDADDVVKRAGQRIAVLDVTSDEPMVRREGLRGDGRYAYASLDSHAILAAKDAPPDLVGAMLRRTQDAKTPSAFDAPDAESLEAAHVSAPLVVFHLAPIGFQPGTPIALLFSRQRSLALAVRPAGTMLAVAVDLRGEFPPGAEHNFRTLVHSMGREPFGASLGLTQVAEGMGVRSDEQGVLLTANLESTAIESTLKLMFAQEMRELFD
ncbi:MAG: hypothetical protein QM778_35505 [Myxococcales bacterium]